MNTDFPQSPREELEMRLTALLLGELSPEEAAAVRQAMAADAALARLHDELKRTMALVGEACASPEAGGSSGAEPEPKLSPGRREVLRTLFSAPPPGPDATPAPKPEKPKRWSRSPKILRPKKEGNRPAIKIDFRTWGTLAAMFLALLGMATLLVGPMVPNRSKYFARLPGSGTDRWNELYSKQLGESSGSYFAAPAVAEGLIMVTNSARPAQTPPPSLSPNPTGARRAIALDADAAAQNRFGGTVVQAAQSVSTLAPLDGASADKAEAGTPSGRNLPRIEPPVPEAVAESQSVADPGASKFGFVDAAPGAEKSAANGPVGGPAGGLAGGFGGRRDNGRGYGGFAGGAGGAATGATADRPGVETTDAYFARSKSLNGSAEGKSAPQSRFDDFRAVEQEKRPFAFGDNAAASGNAPEPVKSYAKPTVLALGLEGAQILSKKASGDSAAFESKAAAAPAPESKNVESWALAVPLPENRSWHANQVALDSAGKVISPVADGELGKPVVLRQRVESFAKDAVALNGLDDSVTSLSKNSGVPPAPAQPGGFPGNARYAYSVANNGTVPAPQGLDLLSVAEESRKAPSPETAMGRVPGEVRQLSASASQSVGQIADMPQHRAADKSEIVAPATDRFATPDDSLVKAKRAPLAESDAKESKRREEQLSQVPQLRPAAVGSALDTGTVRATEHDRIHPEGEVAQLNALLGSFRSKTREELRKAIPTTFRDDAMSRYLNDLEKAEQAYASTVRERSEAHPDALRLRGIITQANKQIEERVDGVLSGLETMVASRKAQVESLAKRADDTKIAALNRELENQSRLRDQIFARILREQVDQKIPKSSTVEIVDEATVPRTDNSLRGRIGRILGKKAESVARITAEKDAGDIQLLMPTAQNAGGYDPYFVQTELERVRSAKVLDEVIAKLNLNEVWAKRDGHGAPLKTEETRKILGKMLEVGQNRGASTIDIRAKSDKPEEAALIANTVAEVYQQSRIEKKARSGISVVASLKEELARQSAKTSEVQKQLEAERKESVSDQAAPPTPVLAPTAGVPQPETLTAENAFSTFSLNVSDVSFQLAGASLEKGQMPDPATVRSEEFVNAFDYRDPEPLGGAPVAFAWERAHYPFAHDRDLLRFSVKTAALGRQAGRPLNLVLLLDNSGSMERADRALIVRECLRTLAGQLKAGDSVSVVAFARTARLWVDALPGERAGELVERVGNLTPQGGTNLEEAMNVGYQTAAKHYLVNGVNRVVLLTDGAANLGDANPESLKKTVEAQRRQGIALDCFGIGWEGYNDDLLETLSRNGDGRYGFVNSPEAAAGEFSGQLAGALRVAASDVKVQVEFNPRRAAAYRQIGYAKHQLKKEQFRDNTVDAAELGAAEAGNALYVVQVNPAGEGPVATVRVRFKIPGTGDYREHEWTVPYTGPAKSLEESGPAIKLAATASAFSEWLVSSPYSAEVTPDRLLTYIAGVPETCGADPRPKKLETMIRQAKSLSGK